MIADDTWEEFKTKAGVEGISLVDEDDFTAWWDMWKAGFNSCKRAMQEPTSSCPYWDIEEKLCYRPKGG